MPKAAGPCQHTFAARGARGMDADPSTADVIGCAPEVADPGSTFACFCIPVPNLPFAAGGRNGPSSRALVNASCHQMRPRSADSIALVNDRGYVSMFRSAAWSFALSLIFCRTWTCWGGTPLQRLQCVSSFRARLSRLTVFRSALGAPCSRTRGRPKGHTGRPPSGASCKAGSQLAFCHARRAAWLQRVG